MSDHEAEELPEIQLLELYLHLHRNDEFMMKEFRSVPCPEEVEDMDFHFDYFCPFFHPNQTYRRHPLWFKYSPKLCPNIGNCPLGGECGFSHNIYEYCLHPKVYRKSNRCFNGESCLVLPCMFPHNPVKLRAARKPPLAAPPRPKPQPLAPLPPLLIPPPRQGGRAATFSRLKSI